MKIQDLVMSQRNLTVLRENFQFIFGAGKDDPATHNQFFDPSKIIVDPRMGDDVEVYFSREDFAARMGEQNNWDKFGYSENVRRGVKKDVGELFFTDFPPRK